MASFAGASAVVGSETALSTDTPAGFPGEFSGTPVAGTLVAFWTVWPVPLPASQQIQKDL